MSNVGYATLQILPSLRNLRKHLQKDADKILADWAKDAGETIGDALSEAAGRGLGDALSQATELDADRIARPVREGVREGVRDGADEGAAEAGKRVRVRLLGPTRAAVADGFRRGFRTGFGVTQSQGRRMRDSLAFGVAGGLIAGAKQGFTALTEGVQAFVSNANEALRGMAKGALSSITTAIEGAGLTAATGGLNLLIGALLAISMAVPAITTGFLALAPVVALVGGLAGSLFTILLGGAATVGVTALAFRGLGDAFKDVMDDGKLTRETLRKLHPEAAKFVKEFGKLRKPFRDLARYVQGRFFEGLSKPFRDLSRRWLPVLEPMLGNLAGSFNRVGKQVMDALGKPDFIKNVRLAVAGFGKFVEHIGNGLEPFIGAIGRLGKAAVPFLDELGRSLGGALENFSKWIEKAEKSGALADFMTDAAQALKDIWAIGGLVIRIAGELIDTFFPSSKKASDSVLGGVRDALENVRAWLADPENKKRLQEFMDKVQEFANRAVTEWIPSLMMVGDTVDGWVKKIEGWGRNLEAWKNHVSLIFAAVELNVGMRITALKRGLGTISNAVTSALEAFERFRRGAVDRLGRLVSFVRSIPGRIVAALGDLGGLLFSAGARIVEGMARGMQSRMGLLTGAGSALGAAARRAVERSLDINSPSRVFMRIGGYAAEGMALGLTAGTPAVTRAAAEMVRVPDVAPREATPSPAGVPIGATTSPGQTHFHLHNGNATLAQLEALMTRQAIRARIGRAR
ncbi:phage tail protein [Micromonospora okii]|uniref:phage tail protein n=1 Tax=Micromonospora okii TaxID=1182970 RepID=UPI001E4EAF75|nr:hypothetical protein [Micromonospora okii]